MILGIYGSGGAGRTVKEAANEINKWSELVFIDDTVSYDEFHGIKRMSFENFQKNFTNQTAEIVISLGEPQYRSKLYEKVKASGFSLTNVIHKNAWISPSAAIGKGVVFLYGAVVNADAVIEDNVVISEFSCVGHDTVVKKHCQIAGGVVIGGNSTINQCTYIGMNASIREQIEIGSDSIIGMGAAVVSDIPHHSIAMGVPAKIIKKRSNETVFKKRSGE